jgi:hypothetical protein
MGDRLSRMLRIDADSAIRREWRHGHTVCSAHGLTYRRHFDGGDPDCARYVGRQCGNCYVYADTGMHWDTCAQRGRP